MPGTSALIWYDPVPPALTRPTVRPSARKRSAVAVKPASASRMARSLSSSGHVRRKCPS